MKRVLFLSLLLTICAVSVFSQDWGDFVREAQYQARLFQWMEYAVIITAFLSGFSFLCLLTIVCARPTKEKQLDSVIKSLDSICKSLKKMENGLESSNICPNCGAEFYDDEQNCPICGTKLRKLMGK